MQKNSFADLQLRTAKTIATADMQHFMKKLRIFSYANASFKLRSCDCGHKKNNGVPPLAASENICVIR
jgi:hypothetical protein